MSLEASDLLDVSPPVFCGEHILGLKTNEVSRQNSSHIVQIEMRGPAFKSLSFIDTPGLYQGKQSPKLQDNYDATRAGNLEQNVTTVGDIKKLVTSLIEEERTCIMYESVNRHTVLKLIQCYSVVMKATQTIVLQEIFTFVEDVDPTGERTIGVMTKCDLANYLTRTLLRG